MESQIKRPSTKLTDSFKNSKAIIKWYAKKGLIFLALIFCCEFIICSAANSQTQKPNIILILGDDIGYKSLKCDSGNLYKTPNLDTLAQMGMRFTQCHSSPICSPSRFSLLTGKYNFRNFVEGGQMGQDQKTIANMLKDAGYKTACFGKWQLDGGNTSLHDFGFDNYAVHDAFKNKQQMLSRYKNPHIYTHGNFLPDSLTLNKYGPDIVSDSLLNFISKNKSNPFFIYYPLILSHQPYSPTPDDTAAFASWNPEANVKLGDTSYFSSMIQYMDKEIGAVINKVKSIGIEKNTLIIFCGDNGTPANISDYVDEDNNIEGGKGLTTEAGTHVPLIVYWPGTIEPSVNNNLIDFTDFLPTLAEIANISLPNYGPLDGVSFSSQLFGKLTTLREWIFDHYDPNPQLLEKTEMTTFRRWAQTAVYKLYDTSALNSVPLFYDIVKDPNEASPIPDNLLSIDQLFEKQKLLSVINNYVYQGYPILSAPVFSNINDSAIITDQILIDGGSTITSSGFVWSTNPNPTIVSAHTNNNVTIGFFTDSLQNLPADTICYVRAYAKNLAGITYSSQVSFKTLPISPLAKPATEVNGEGFIANWDVLKNVQGYKLDVSTSPLFALQHSDSILVNFNSGANLPKDWHCNDTLTFDSINFGQASPSIELKQTGQQLTSSKYTQPVSNLSFWIKGMYTTGSSLLIEGFDGYVWTIIDNITTIPNNAVIKTYSFSTTPSLKKGFTQFRFTYTRGNGYVCLDDIKMKYIIETPFFVPGYENVAVSNNYLLIQGLKKDTQYYYRVRAQALDGTVSGNSNIISVVACKSSAIQKINAANLSCYENNSGGINIDIPEPELKFSWNGPGNFVSVNQNIDKLNAGSYHLSISSNEICTIDTTVNITEPPAIKTTVSFDSVICQNNLSQFDIHATGGVGKYSYAVINTIDTTEFQQNEFFDLYAGKYKFIIRDSDNCLYTTKQFVVKEINCDTVVNGTLQVNIFPNPSNLEFKLKVIRAKNQIIQLYVTDEFGNKVYQASGDKNKLFVFGRTFAPGVYFVHVIQSDGKKTVKIIKTSR